MSHQSASELLDQWSLKGRHYVVTGGAAGIGLSIVQALLAHQARTVIFCSRNAGSNIDDTIADLVTHWRVDPETKIIHIPCDVSTNEGRQQLFHDVSQHITDVHGLVNNVGYNTRKSLQEQTEEEYYQIMRTNVDSTYFLCQLFQPLLAKASSSAVVNISSAAGVRSSGTGISYAMSKAAINQLTRTLACEWASSNIRVNAIAPWMTMTPMLAKATAAAGSSDDPFVKVKEWTPMSRLAQPEEIAAPALFLLLPCNSYMTGQIISVDGGLDAQAFDGPCIQKKSQAFDDPYIQKKEK